MIVMRGNTTVLVHCKKQKIITKDFTETELVGVSDIMDKVEGAHEYLVRQGHKLKPPLVLKDNQSTMDLFKKEKCMPLRNHNLTTRRARIHLKRSTRRAHVHPDG